MEKQLLHVRSYYYLESCYLNLKFSMTDCHTYFEFCLRKPDICSKIYQKNFRNIKSRAKLRHVKFF